MWLTSKANVPVKSVIYECRHVSVGVPPTVRMLSQSPLTDLHMKQPAHLPFGLLRVAQVLLL